jgi:hypothetical protein
MKRLVSILLLLTISSLSFSNKYDVTVEQSGYVYICTGPYASKYHSHPNCRGMNNCSGEIIGVNLYEARSKGFNPCNICY